MDGPLLKNIDGPSEIVKTHCVGPGKLSCNDQLPLFCTIFFLNTQYMTNLTLVSPVKMEYG